MTYITGDIHGILERIIRFCKEEKTTTDDVIVILGDAGFNYFLDRRDHWMKYKAAHLPITILCVHGNHEARPYMIPSYREEAWHGGIVYREDGYPNLLFAKDGSIFNLQGARGMRKVLVAGGAHSIPCCSERLFEDDKPTPKIRQDIEHALEKVGWKVDYVFSHTCPVLAMPHECFIAGVPESDINQDTEMWLQTVSERLSFEKWFCGHFHTDKVELPYRFMFFDIDEMP